MKKNQNKIAMEALQTLISACPNQEFAANKLKISPQYLSDILNNRRGISDNIARKLGLRKIVSYEAIAP